MRASLLFGTIVVATVTLAVVLLGPRTARLGGHRTSATCVATLRYDGGKYLGYGHLGMKAGSPLTQRATEPGCDDTPGNGQDEPDVPVKVQRVRGVDPHIAIWRGGALYVNASTFAALPTHPLHAVFVKALRYRAPKRTGRRCTVTGVAEISARFFSVGGASITVDADTTVDLQRYGTGYVANGTRVTVTGQPCTREPTILRVRALRISRAR